MCMKIIDILILSVSFYLIVASIYIIDSMLWHKEMKEKVYDIHSYIEELKVDWITIYSE